MAPAEIPQHVIDAAEITTISQLIVKEREARDQGRWKTLRDCFHADALIRISWITGNADEFVNGSIDMAKRGVLAKHRLGPILVHRNGDRAIAMLTGIIDIPVKLDGVEAQLSSHARFFYRVERRAERWRLAGFEAVYVRDELVPSVPGQTLSIAPDELGKFRPSYRLLSYVLSRNAYRVNPDLPGEDRPAINAALEAELFGWAGITPPI
jgi:SnoaL-like protein